VSGAREQAYARLAAQRPRPALDAAPLEAFGARFTRQGGICARLAAIAELPGYIAGHFRAAEEGPLDVILSADPVFEALDWSRQPQLRTRPAGARPCGALAVTSAFAGVAETGSLAVYPRAGAPMALNFLPDRLLVVVRAQDVVMNLEDFWQRTRARFGSELPRGLCLVSGPSSTGDIAMSFTTGVHGPIEVHALVLG
jgi:L-lactate dehydrogenase complex protein LldG